MASPAARSPSVSSGLRTFASKAFRRTRRTRSVALPRRMRRALFNSGRRSTSKSRRSTLGGCHATETQRQGDKRTRGQEDKEKWRQGDKMFFSLSPCLLVSLSPCLPLPLYFPLYLCGRSDGFFRE